MDVLHFGGGGLLIQRLAHIAIAGFQRIEQPDVLDRHRCLVGKGFEELDLAGRERLDLAPSAADDADRPTLSEYRHREE